MLFTVVPQVAAQANSSSHGGLALLLALLLLLLVGMLAVFATHATKCGTVWRKVVKDDPLTGAPNYYLYTSFGDLAVSEEHYQQVSEGQAVTRRQVEAWRRQVTPPSSL